MKKIKAFDLLEKRNLLRPERLERNLMRKEFQIIAVKEEIFWKQHSRVRWLKEGDKNTTFFITLCRNGNVLMAFLGLVMNNVWT